jgi:hypothetical protein
VQHFFDRELEKTIMRAINKVGGYIELAPFKAKDGVTDAAILNAVDTMQATMRTFSGFLRRETLKMEDGNWLDIVLWRDKVSVEAAMEQMHGSHACQDFFALINETGVPMSFGGVMRSHNA